jgi:D-threo-aldose 1-dehydrogenase
MALVCEEFGLGLPTAAAAFAAQHPAVVSVLVGLRTSEQVHDLVARRRRTVPDDLWTALTERGLLDPEVLS